MIFVQNPFCPPELCRLIPQAGRARELPAKASEKTDGKRKSITPHNITHFVNKWICFDSICMSDWVTCSLPIWTSSPSLPKLTVIYGIEALHSCALWCLIQGPTTRQGGERGCVGNSPGLRSSGTLISYKYSLCCSFWSLCGFGAVTPLRGLKGHARPDCESTNWTGRVEIVSHLESWICMIFLDMTLNLSAINAGSNHRSILSVLNSDKKNSAVWCVVSFPFSLTSTVAFSPSPALSVLLTLSFSSPDTLWDLFQPRAARANGGCLQFTV